MADDRVPNSQSLRPNAGLPLRERVMAADNYGVLLLLILTSILVSAVLSGRNLGSPLSLIVLGGTLLFAMKTSRVEHRLRRVAYYLVPILVVSVGIGIIAYQESRLIQVVVSGLSALLVVAAIAAIASRVGTFTRISLQTMLAALSIYLLMGLFYASVFSLVSSVGGHPFFAQPGAHGTADFMYFSYVTMSTVGYGDLTPAGDVGRMLAVSEGLLGQMFLVTVVALTVGNLGRPTRRAKIPDQGDE